MELVEFPLFHYLTKWYSNVRHALRITKVRLLTFQSFLLAKLIDKLLRTCDKTKWNKDKKLFFSNLVSFIRHISFLNGLKIDVPYYLSFLSCNVLLNSADSYRFYHHIILYRIYFFFKLIHLDKFNSFLGKYYIK